MPDIGVQPGPIRSKGRPRQASIDVAVIDATLRQLAAVGYSRLSIESVAAEAGVGRPAVYRRWRNKAELVTTAIEHLRVREAGQSTGDTRRDLEAQLERVRRYFEELGGMALIGTLLVEEERHPELLELFRERVVRPRRAELREVLAAGQARGDVRPDLDLDAAVNLLVGGFYSRCVSGERFPRPWARQMLETLWPAFST
jgi:AcrR family transcriptional regulator